MSPWQLTPMTRTLRPLRRPRRGSTACVPPSRPWAFVWLRAWSHSTAGGLLCTGQTGRTARSGSTEGCMVGRGPGARSSPAHSPHGGRWSRQSSSEGCRPMRRVAPAWVERARLLQRGPQACGRCAPDSSSSRLRSSSGASSGGIPCALRSASRSGGKAFCARSWPLEGVRRHGNLV